MKILVAILVLLAGLVVAGILVGPKMVNMVREQMPDDGKTVVRLANPERGDLIEIVQAPGSIEPETNVELSARISARIMELPFEEGHIVKQGDVVIRLDDSDYRSSLRAAEARKAAEEASLEVARKQLGVQERSIEAQIASLDQAKLDLDRNRNLLKSKDVARSTVDSLESQVEELEARLAGAHESLQADEMALVVREHNITASDADIERLRTELEYSIIKSPIEGIVTKLNAEVGELVMTGTMNNAGTVIMEIADLGRMLLIAEVDESHIGTVSVGQPAIVRINAYPDEIFEGHVQNVALTSSRANDGSKFYRTEILIDTKGKQIYSGLTADVEIETYRHTDVLKVPSQAVLARNVENIDFTIRDGNPDVDMTKTFAMVVFRYVDGKAVVTPVTIGAIDLTQTVILSGLEEDQQIVVGPYKVLETIGHDQELKDEREQIAEDDAKKRDEADDSEESDSTTEEEESQADQDNEEG